MTKYNDTRVNTILYYRVEMNKLKNVHVRVIFVQIIVLGFLPLLYYVLNKSCHISQKIDFFKPIFVLEC